MLDVRGGLDITPSDDIGARPGSASRRLFDSISVRLASSRRSSVVLPYVILFVVDLGTR